VLVDIGADELLLGNGPPAAVAATISEGQSESQQGGAPVAEPYLGTRPAPYALRLGGWRGAAGATCQQVSARRG
jgi:hypothetical protein